MGVILNDDSEKAFYWAEKSAKQGNAYAQGILGNYYNSGFGTKKTIKKHFIGTKSAKQGDANG